MANKLMYIPNDNAQKSLKVFKVVKQTNKKFLETSVMNRAIVPSLPGYLVCSNDIWLIDYFFVKVGNLANHCVSS